MALMGMGARDVEELPGGDETFSEAENFHNLFSLT